MRVPRQSGQDWLCSTKYEGYLWSSLWRSVLAWDKIRFWADILCFLGIISLYGALFCFRILLTSVFINLGPGCCPLSGFFYLEYMSRRKQNGVCDMLWPYCHPPVVSKKTWHPNKSSVVWFYHNEGSSIVGLVIVLPSGPDITIWVTWVFF